MTSVLLLVLVKIREIFLVVVVLIIRPAPLGHSTAAAHSEVSRLRKQSKLDWLVLIHEFKQEK